VRVVAVKGKGVVVNHHRVVSGEWVVVNRHGAVNGERNSDHDRVVLANRRCVVVSRGGVVLSATFANDGRRWIGSRDRSRDGEWLVQVNDVNGE
jgi:hypothetical protein